MTRREFATVAAACLVTNAALQGAAPKSTLGIATTSYLSFGKPKDTLAFLDHCHELGASGIQAAINGDPVAIRERAEKYGMWIETMLQLPKTVDTAQFEKAVIAAKAAGALCGRCGALSGRRYETFNTRAEWDRYVAQTNASLDAILPVLEKHKFPFALENHKDFTLEEMLPYMKQHASDYFGVCLDFGNNISLLDDPMDFITQMAPYAITTHVKDMGLELYEDGFLLSEVPLGQGYLDLRKMIALVRAARPKVNLVLEMITRDPLKVPCLTDKYWVTFPDRSGRYLAKTLKAAGHEGARPHPLPRVQGLDPQAQLRLEDQNVKLCLNLAREEYAL